MQENEILKLEKEREKDNCLFLGDGVSRCFNGLSWDELLKKLAYNNFRSVIKNIPPILTFEELKNSIKG